MDRIIALIDMDCFYVQVEQRDEPSTWGTPAAVEQYTGGGVIAVNYEARAAGVQRGMSGAQSRAKCNDIRLFRVPEQRGKADLTKYRNASAEVFTILCSFHEKIIVERASIDEAFLDLTEYVKTDEAAVDDMDISDVAIEGFPATDDATAIDLFAAHVISDECAESRMLNQSLILAAKAVKRIRTRIREETQFACTAGISHSKVLSKLACGVRKPNGQTVVPAVGIATIYARTPIKKVRGLGGKLGHLIRDAFKIETMAELGALSVVQLSSVTSADTARWLLDLSRGVDGEQVSNRQLLKSVGCGKNFTGLTTLDQLTHWIAQLAGELVERLIQERNDNKRTATSFTFGVRLKNHAESYTKALPITCYDVATISKDIARHGLSRLQMSENNTFHPIINMSLVASRFVDATDAVSNTRQLSDYFTPCARRPEEAPSGVEAEAEVEPLTAAVTANSSDELSSDGFQLADSEMESATETEQSFVISSGFFYRKTLEFNHSCSGQNSELIDLIELSE